MITPYFINMNASIIITVLSSLAVLCNGSKILYDVKVSELVDGKEINTQEQEVMIEEDLSSPESMKENQVFIAESFLTTEPPIIEMTYSGDEKEVDGFVGRASFNLTDIGYEMPFEKDDRPIPEEHQNFQVAFGSGLVSNPEWSDWTCCRRVVNIQSRQRIRQAPRIEMEYKRCRGDYCSGSMCSDNINVCDQFMLSMGSSICHPSNMMSTFMSHHCPVSCKFCDGPSTPPTARPTRPTFPWNPQTTRPQTTEVPWWKKTRAATTTRRPETTTPWWATRRTTTTTKAPAANSNLVKVTIFSHGLNGPYPSYQFSKRRFENPQYPWQRIPEGGSELASLYLYKTATPQYSLAIRFCSANDRKNGIKKWSVRRSRCSNAWKEEFKFYGSQYRYKSSQLYYVGNRGKPHWTTRVSTDFPSNGYTSNLFYFYGPKMDEIQPPITRPTRPTTTTRRPFTTRRPTTTPWWMTSRPTTTPRPWTTPRPTTTQRPVSGGNRPQYPVSDPNAQFSRSVFNQNCLRAHNFFRAVHNVPPLKWSAELAKTAQSWANQLKRIAPERPNELKLPHLRTRNWPHSDSGSGHRNRGDGENIAWDLSSDGSPVEESVQRWYAEIFYFDRRNPTRAPAPDKPVGHLTQLLWKDTTHLGCGVGITEVQYSRYTLKSTWTVSHYSPGGNVHYGNSISMTNKLFDEQVPDMERGACMTKSGSCNNGNQCMAFGPSRGTCSCNGGKASCQSAGGCIAWCVNKGNNWPWKEECSGRSSCYCGDEGATCE